MPSPAPIANLGPGEYGRALDDGSLVVVAIDTAPSPTSPDKVRMTARAWQVDSAGAPVLVDGARVTAEPRAYEFLRSENAYARAMEAIGAACEAMRSRVVAQSQPVPDGHVANPGPMDDA